MSAPVGKFLQSDLLSKINDFVSFLLQKSEVSIREIKFGKRNSGFLKGDICLARGCASASDEVMLKVRKSLVEELGRKLYFKSVTSDKLNSLVIFLNREIYFKHVLTCVHNQSTSYGKSAQEKKEIIVYNHRFRSKEDYRKTETCSGSIQNDLCITLDTLRSLVLAEHLTLLLQENGYKVRNIVPDISWEPVVDICDKLSIDTNSFVKTEVTPQDIHSILSIIQSHTTVTTQHRQTIPASDTALSCSKQMDNVGDHPIIPCLKSLWPQDIHQDIEATLRECAPCYSMVKKWTTGFSIILHQERSDMAPPHCNILEFDAKHFISEHGLPDGRNSFDKNLNTFCLAEDSQPSQLLKEAVRIHKNIQDPNQAQIIHVAEHSLSFTAQKIDLILKLLSRANHFKQFHFVHGNVSKTKDCNTSEEFSPNSYLRLRYQQMKEAAILKYGDSVQGDGWEHTLNCLTIACVKFELLSNTARNTVKLKLDSSEEGSVENSLQGSFVMYNCARLATLLVHFEDGVKKGTYPPLPSVDTIDFSMLREEEEWGLLFNYVHPYPDIVRETIKEMKNDKSMFVSLSTQKICQMLIGLSRAVSSYYSRYHVLGEARPHLLPTMFARLYLLKAVHQVMINSLKLLGITPLSQL